jgi:D-hydroxyproline dehydrogenase subunit beta
MRQNSTLQNSVDIAVIGAGILGLATAWAAAKRGLKVAIFEKNPRADGASLRNFGFMTLSGQDPLTIWPRVLRSRELWLQLCEHARIPIHQRGMLLLAQRPLAVRVLEEFMQTERGQGCRLLSRPEMRKTLAPGMADHLAGMLYSPHEIRVESTEAIPQFTAWLQEAYAVEVYTDCEVVEIDHQTIRSSKGDWQAKYSIVCAGAESAGPMGGRIESDNITCCQLQMLRLESPGFKFPATLMSDFSLIRYGDFAQQPTAIALKQRLTQEHPELIEHGIHLIVAQSADGSLVVGDSHAYALKPSGISQPKIDDLILAEYQRCFNQSAPAIRSRWLGVYSSRTGYPIVIESPQSNVRALAVTSGCGASIGLALGEEVIAHLLD